ncbi:MAG TPA: hypothetical protein VLL08_33065 [Kineosporiaceae bacterium]|nr:hypothetical protein [Kineosporiaceae bacterium]
MVSLRRLNEYVVPVSDAVSTIFVLVALVHSGSVSPVLAAPFFRRLDAPAAAVACDCVAGDCAAARSGDPGVPEVGAQAATAISDTATTHSRVAWASLSR